MGINWAGAEAHAAEMSNEAIKFAIDDILETLPHADGLDREDGQDRGGRYRDQASILRAELRKRGYAHINGILCPY